jgi:hypothetical protein
VQDHAQHESEQRVRRHTGLVDLVVVGERPRPKTPAEIVELAEATEFFEEGKIESRYEGGSIEFVPALVPEGQNAIGLALMEGMVSYKITIKDAPPREFLQQLGPGTYYIFIDFVEGPDFEKGRWIARVVDEGARFSWLILSVEISQVVNFHPDRPDLTHEHRRPRISIHGAAPLDDTGTVYETAAGGPRWVDGSTWESTGGSGCLTTLSCIGLVIAV